MIGPKTIGKITTLISAGREAKAVIKIGNTITTSMSRSSLKLILHNTKGIDIIVTRALSNSISTRKISLINMVTINM